MNITDPRSWEVRIYGHFEHKKLLLINLNLVRFKYLYLFENGAILEIELNTLLKPTNFHIVPILYINCYIFRTVIG